MAVVASAVEMGARQREISVSEFFTKNRHLLGFDNPRKALLTCVKEAVDNALDASEEAGILPDVVVTLEVAAGTDAALPASQATRFRVTVTDNGPGIAPEVMERIFSPFFTTKPQGSGLGLAIVRKIVDAHDGRIDVGVRPGGGTVFRVTLPVRSQQQVVVS